MAADIGRKVLKNSFFILCGRVWFLGLSIVLTPYLLGGLGRSVYGVWVLVDSIVRMVGLADFGFSTSFVKHVAEHHASRNTRAVSGVLTAGLLGYGVVAVVMIALVFSTVNAIVDFFTVPSALEESTKLVLKIAVVASSCGYLVGVYHSIINGLQRMEISNGIAVFMSLFYAGGCIVVVERGLGIVGLAVNQLLTQLIGIAVSVIVVRRLYPGLKTRFDSAKEQFGRLLHYGINLHLSNVAVMVNAHFDKLLVNRVIDVSHVALYEVGSRPPATARTSAVLLLSSLTPAASEMEVTEGKENLYDLFRQASRYAAALLFPLFLGMMVLGRPLIVAWVGEGYETSIVVLVVLSLGHLFYSVVGPVSPFVQGMGHPEHQRNAEALSLVLNVFLSVILVWRYGFFGAAVGTTIAIVVSSLYYLIVFHRFIRKPLRAFVLQVYVKPAACAVAAGSLTFVMLSSLLSRIGDGRLAMLGAVLAMGLVFAVLYVTSMLMMGYFRTEELRLLKKYLLSGWIRK